VNQEERRTPLSTLSSACGLNNVFVGLIGSFAIEAAFDRGVKAEADELELELDSEDSRSSSSETSKPRRLLPLGTTTLQPALELRLVDMIGSRFEEANKQSRAQTVERRQK
jgi:hypothetical protein